MERLIHYFENSYFLNLASFVIAVICYLISIKIGRRNSELYLLKYYFLSYVVLCLAFFSEVVFLKSTKARHQTELLTDFVFTLAEFLILILFFQRFFNKRRLERSVIVFIKYAFPILSLGLCLFDIVKLGELTLATNQNTFSVQAILLLVPCIFYYRSIFMEAPGRRAILDRPEFWIATGISLFMLSTLPFSLLMNYLDEGLLTMLYTIFDVFYCLLFLMIMRAFWCKPFLLGEKGEHGLS